MLGSFQRFPAVLAVVTLGLEDFPRCSGILGVRRFATKWKKSSTGEALQAEHLRAVSSDRGAERDAEQEGSQISWITPRHLQHKQNLLFQPGSLKGRTCRHLSHQRRRLGSTGERLEVIQPELRETEEHSGAEMLVQDTGAISGTQRRSPGAQETSKTSSVLGPPHTYVTCEHLPKCSKGSTTL